MIIDISSYNGKIDYDLLRQGEKIERVILRATTKNGELDGRFIENLNGIITKLDTDVIIDAYKFSYSRDYVNATLEAYELIARLKQAGAIQFINILWLDLEAWGGRDYLYKEAGEVIAAYANVCAQFGVKFGIYCNYYYLLSIVPKWAKIWPFWVARWSSKLGDVSEYNVKLWQYSNKGQLAGIKGNVDLSRVV